MNDNLFQDLPDDCPEEIVDSLIHRDNVRIERIVSDGQASADGFWYDQSENEFVLLLQGTAVLEFDDGQQVELKTGSWMEIPARRKHRVVSTSRQPKTVWLAVFWT